MEKPVRSKPRVESGEVLLTVYRQVSIGSVFSADNGMHPLSAALDIIGDVVRTELRDYRPVSETYVAKFDGQSLTVSLSPDSQGT